MTYELIKSAHLIAMLTWMAGMTAVLLGLRHADQTVLRALRAHDRRVTTPAMVLTWIFGAALAFQGGWFGSGWLWWKLALVLGLSGFHGLLTGQLRRVMTAGSTAPASAQTRRLWLGWACVAIVVLLVTTKPF